MRSEIAKIQAGYEQKLAELDILEETKRKYVEEDIERISEANRLEKEVEQIDAKIASIEAEKAVLEKQKALQSTGSKDILAEIQDKEMLKQKADVVIDIIHRNKFTRTPAEIGEVLATQLGAVLSPISEPVVEEVEETVAVEETITPVEEVIVPVIEEQPTELVISSNEETTEPEVTEESNKIEYKPVFDIITDTSLDTSVPVSEVMEEEPIDTITVATDNVEIIDTPEVEMESTNLENTMINDNDLVSLLEEQAQPTETVEDGKVKVTGEESVRVESQVVPENTATDVLDLSVLFPGEVDSYSEQSFTPIEEFAPVGDSESIQEEFVPVVEEQPSQVESQIKVDNMIDFFDHILNPDMEQQEEGPRLGKVA